MKKFLYAILASALLMICLLVILINWPAVQAPARTQSGPLIIENANIIDAETGVIAPDMTLVRAGLSPLEALQAATVLSANFSGLGGSGGTVEKDKWADLLILNANPLEDITNTQDIFAVISYGSYYDRSALDELLTFSEKQANSLRTNTQLLWSLIASPLMRRQMVD